MRLLALAAFTLLAAGAAAAADVNDARLSDLDGTRGIGPEMSRRILAEREKGPFQDWADLMARVKGIGPAKAQQLSGEGLTVNGAQFERRPPSAAPPRASAPRASPRPASPRPASPRPASPPLASPPPASPPRASP